MLIATLSAEQKRKEKKKWREREKKKRRGALCPAMAMGFLFNRLLQIAFFCTELHYVLFISPPTRREYGQIKVHNMIHQK